jgi:hypothetical protein
MDGTVPALCFGTEGGGGIEISRIVAGGKTTSSSSVETEVA